MAKKEAVKKPVEKVVKGEDVIDYRDVRNDRVKELEAMGWKLCARQDKEDVKRMERKKQ